MSYKKTVLQLVQEILSSIDGGEVNSYLDTTESLQVARILENVYWDIVSTSSFGTSFSFYELDPSNNVTLPTVMYLPNSAVTLESLMYDYATLADVSPNFHQVNYLEPTLFLSRMYSLKSDDASVVSYTLPLTAGGTLSVMGYNNQSPKWYTTYDDKTILFDSYDSSVDSTLQANKTLAYGELNPTWTMSDSFVPDLPEKQFTILRNEAKSIAFIELKQQTNTKAEKQARRGWISSQKTGDRIKDKQARLNRVPDYGKKR
jgi:hypothetical protein